MNNLIPEGWQLAPITEFASLKHGHQFRTPDFSETGVRVIKIGQVVGGGKVSLKNCDFVRSDVYKETKGFELKGGEILMSLTGNIGRVGIVPYVPYPLLQNYRVGLFSPTNGKCNKEYLAQILGSELVTQQLIDKSNVTAQANFGKADLEQVIVQMPPLPEQQKIATILSSVDEVIEKTRAQIDKLKDLKTAMMQELLTKGIGHTEFKDSPVGRIPASWDVQLLHDVCERVCVGFVGTCERHYRASGVPMIRTGNLKDGKLDLTGVRHVTDEFHKKEKKSQLKAGDLLIARHGSHGSACLVPENLGEANCLNVVIVRPSQTLAMPLFLKYVFNSGAMKASFGAKSEGSTQSVISTTEIAKTAFPIPSIAEQRQISAALSTIDGRIESVERKLTNSLALKKALMQDLLTGKVRVKLNESVAL